MNNKDLMNAIGGISDKHVEACAEAPAAEAKTTEKITEIAPARAKRPKRWIPILAAAAMLIIALAMIPILKKPNASPQGEITANATPAPTLVPTAAPTAAPTAVPTAEPTAVTTGEPPETEPVTTNLPLDVRHVKLGGGHTATFTLPIMQIHSDFELPEGFELRTEKGDETHIPLWTMSLDNEDFCGYIYDRDGVLVGGFWCWPYEDDVDESIIEWVYAYFRTNHWRVLLEEMYEPIEADGPCIPALTLSEGVDVIPGQNFAANGTFLCDAVVAYEPEQNLTIEIVFDQGVLTREQLIAIAQSIRLEREDA